ncbi:uncharacterized protein LOC126704117 [Quercus robur]|uniref:uncharacterized protein LOC126704117 n=1 Tax=Quercus robur TaxID=38942 RepID=UPI0021633B44|nr:uncharacterized protein LOC126704117 [Quercus robur]
MEDEVREATVAELIDQDLHAWRADFIMDMFEKEDAEAICRIQLSRRHVEDCMIWMHQRKGIFTVKSAYKVARKVLSEGRVAESSRGCAGKEVWPAIWKLRIPNKIKVFGWRACNEILPTKLNLSKRKIIVDAMCPICLRFPESVVHALWECGAARDVWVGSLKILQKGGSRMVDMLQLMEYLMEQVKSHDMEVMLVQAWLIWNQRNRVVHGGKFHNLGWLNNRATEFLEEFQTTTILMGPSHGGQASRDTWQPPSPSIFKLNFDAALFSALNSSGFGAVIRNEKGEAMAAMATKGPEVSSSEEAKFLACRKAIEFAADAGFFELVIEGDSSVMKVVSALQDDFSLLGNVVGDIHHLVRKLQWVRIECTRRGGNS